ncbi:MAG: endonuclease/exonuclease/phosphatase family protein [Candidatus Omnitrophica bacterium]|nr:endonuclease/exonuclease/phosphatase family protein [Candidatus Omnitrophota bacterium]
MRGKIYLTLFATLSIAGYFSRFGYWFDLTTHFQPQYLVGLLLCAAMGAWRKRWKIVLAALLCAMIPGSRILPLYLPLTRTAHAGPATTFTILLVNIKAENAQYQKLRNYIIKTDPDILALEEIDQTWNSQLEDVLKTFPFAIHEFREDNFGIGLYSKLPLDDLKIERFSAVPSVSGNLTINGQPVTLLLTHPIPPTRYSSFDIRNSHYENMAKKRPEYHDNLVLIGDMNSSSWSHFFRKLAKDMGLRDSRNGFGLQLSWPTMTELLLTTIDHCLVSQNIVVYDRRIGDDIGSDHYPVFLELAVPDNPASDSAANDD